MRLISATAMLALTLGMLPVSAGAQTGPDQIDHVEGPPGRLAPGFNRQDARLVRPGALLLASYDQNYDGVISAREIDDGAEASFKLADTNGDDVLGGFELSDWAASVGGDGDVLSNPMLFDADLDRQTTRAEFIAGVKRLSQSAETSEPGVLRLRDLTQPLGDRDGRPGQQRY